MGWRMKLRVVFGLLAAGLVLASGRPALGVAIQELARLSGQGETVLRGLGFVVGLPGTGDPSENPALARQLARLLEENGSPVPDLRELAKGRNIATVMVTCVVPREGARRGDKLDVFVQTWASAKSLEGGRLYITPLQGPLPGQGVYAFAEGALMFEEGSKTVGRVRGGARVSHDITMGVVGGDGTITLVIEPAYAGWPTAELLASAINADRQGLDETLAQLARAMDEKTVRVQIPETERSDPANFISSVMEIRLDASLLTLPARVIVNERKGTIVVTGDVEISPAAIAHRDLVITTLTPAREPTPANPEMRRSRWTSIDTGAGERERARVEDLLEALKQLDVPVVDQIAILAKLSKIGRLHAEFIVE